MRRTMIFYKNRKYKKGKMGFSNWKNWDGGFLFDRVEKVLSLFIICRDDVCSASPSLEAVTQKKHDTSFQFRLGFPPDKK